MSNKMFTPEKIPTQNRSSSSNKKEPPSNAPLLNGENEIMNNDQTRKEGLNQTKNQSSKECTEKSSSSTLLPSVNSKQNLRNKTVQPISAQEFDKIFNNQPNNDKIIFPEKNKNSMTKITNEFRQCNKGKQGGGGAVGVGIIKGTNDHRPSLKEPQSVELFQKEHLQGLLNQSPNKSKVVAQPQLNALEVKETNENDDDEFSYDEEEDAGLSSKKKVIRQSFGLSQAGRYEKDVAKENQDSFFVLKSVLGLDDFNIYGVMDGHGANGHFVSGYIKQSAEDYFTKEETYRNPKKSKQNLCSSLIYNKIIANDHGIIKAFFKKTSDELINEKFDVHYSGSTCVIVFHIENKILCANVGDSRAIIIQDNRSTVESPSSDPFAYFEVVPLSNDHKPELPQEKDRIEKMGGIVEKSKEKDGSQDGPYRVFLKGEKYPGIAMSRSLGDEIAESIGVVHTPEVIIKDMSNKFKYLILASDGVWEFLPNEKVMSIINLHFFRNDIKSACEAVISEATLWWKKEDAVIDDITIVIAFLGSIHIKKCTV